MSQYLESLQLGEIVDFRGPGGLLEYKGQGLIPFNLILYGSPIICWFSQAFCATVSDEQEPSVCQSVFFISL